MNFAKIIEISKAYDKNLFPSRSLHLTFVLYKNRILQIAQNKKTTHPINLLNRKISKTGTDFSNSGCRCSELNALIQIRNLTNIKYNKLILVNVRINKLGEINWSKPCNSCRNLLNYFKFKSVYFSTQNGFQKYEI